MTAHIVGYARRSTNGHDLTVQRNGSLPLGIPADRVCVDPDSPAGTGNAQACAKSSRPSALTTLSPSSNSTGSPVHEIIEDLTKRNVKLSIGGSIHDPIDLVGRLLFNVLAMIAEFESDLLRACEGMQVAKAKGRLPDKTTQLTKSQEAHLVFLYKLVGTPGHRRDRRTVQGCTRHDLPIIQRTPALKSGMNLKDHASDETDTTQS
jgi:hypothetical protein